MGHRFSKSLTTSNSTEQEEQIQKQKQIQNIPEIITESSTTNHNNNQNLIQPTTINLITNQNLQLIQTNCNNQSARRFIIKIQLTKMELPSQQNVEQNSNSSSSSSNSNSKENLSTASTNNNNLNITTQRPQILNLTTFTKNIPCDLNNINSNNNLTTVASTSSSTTSQIIQQNNNNNNDEIKLNNLNIENFNNRSAGSPVMVNNNFVSNFSTAPFIDDDNNDLIANNNNNNCSATTTSQSLFRQQQQQNNNFENNLNISVQRLQECNIMDNSNCNSNNNNNIIGAEYQDVPDINQRVSIHQINNQATTNSIKEKENNTTSTMCANNSQDQKSHCCRRKSSSTSSAYPSKWRCCKCACRDAVKKIVNTGQSSSTNCQNTNDISSSTSSKSGHSWTSRFSCNNKKDNNNQNQLKQISNDNSSNLSNATLPVPSTVPVATAAPTATNHLALWSPDLNPNLLHSTAGLSVGAPIPPTVPTNHLALWSPTNEVVIPITARPGEILVVQCPQSLQCPQPLVCRIEDFEERARRRREIEIETGVDILSQAELDAALSAPWHPIICSPSPAGLTFTAPGGTVVHSRVDYIHCLVPDLEKITSSSFYWGKMDRYEAERLLEGKPEGTFLLRDSAQEEYLFSVTFRKYGRSLHARIEQFNHKFSFDCHDPGVFTAPTVTGLLEHYKDPSCVMFFEPMLTIPLNRNFSFSLQQLCRATIVSNISYDGINELQLPNSLKGYLKEYHYKLRVRVKPFDEPFYSCS